MSDTATSPENLARLFAENMRRSLSFPALEALHHALGVLDVGSLRGAIAGVYEPAKALRIATERVCANPEREALRARLMEERAERQREIDAASEEMGRRFAERRQAGILTPSMQARHAELASGAL